MNNIRNAFVKTIGLGLLLVANAALAQTVVVDPSDPPSSLRGWFEQNVNPGVVPGTVSLSATSPVGGPAGPGALELILDGVDDQQVGAARTPLTTVSAITAISWSASSTTDLLPLAKVEYYSRSRSGTLFPVQPAYVGGSGWVTIDGMALQWYTTEAGYPNSMTFQEWQTDLGGTLVNFFSVNMGSSNSVQAATIAYADMVTLSGTSWNFEGDAVLPPQPAVPSASIPTLSVWALITLVLLVGGVAFVRRERLS